jgi:hypothetical protein
MDVRMAFSSSFHLVVCGEQSEKKSRDGTPRLSSPAVLKDFSSLTLLDFLSPSDPECYSRFLGSLKETKGEKITLIILQQWLSYCVDLFFLEPQRHATSIALQLARVSPFFISSLRCKQLVAGEEDCEVTATLRSML